jgi:large-conductance mechanosensitive channel
MSFWEAFFAVIIAWIISELTYLQLDFFQYNFFNDGQFVLTSLFKFILDILLFVIIYAAIYFSIPRLKQWRMRAKYEAAQKERAKEE